MILPTVSELRNSLSTFIEKEQITFRTVLRPMQVIGILTRHRFLHFFVIGSCGTLINLGVTWFFTSFIFGLEEYFTAFVIGICANLSFNFIVYSLVIFRTTRDHFRRLVVFIVWSLGMTALQASIVRMLVPVVGFEWYLLVIASVIFFFAFVNFLVFKLSIFKERFRF